jgi:hypothetical protein
MHAHELQVGERGEFARATSDQRQVKELLRHWEEETVHALAISGRKV